MTEEIQSIPLDINIIVIFNPDATFKEYNVDLINENRKKLEEILKEDSKFS